MRLWKRAARRPAKPPVKPASTGIPLLPPTVVGLTPSQARARYLRRTAAVVGLVVIGWLLFFRLTLNDTVGDLRLMRAPRHTAVVEPSAPSADGSRLEMRWTRPDGTEGYGAIPAEDQDRYRLGQRVRVLDSATAGCQVWTTVEDQTEAVEAIVVFLLIIPLGAIFSYLVHRYLWWRRLVASTRIPWPAGRVTGVYGFGHRQGLDVEIDGRRVHVPLLGGQFVTALESYRALKPLRAHQLSSRGGQKVIPFRVEGTDRIVWPSGPYRTVLVPYGAIAVRVLWFGGPALLALLVHISTAPVVGTC